MENKETFTQTYVKFELNKVTYRYIFENSIIVMNPTK